MRLRAEQLANVPSLISVRPSGRLISVRAEQPLNALVPIPVTLSGTVTEVISVLFRKAQLQHTGDHDFCVRAIPARDRHPGTVLIDRIGKIALRVCIGCQRWLQQRQGRILRHGTDGQCRRRKDAQDAFLRKLHIFSSFFIR